MKVRTREKINPLHLRKGDTVNLSYTKAVRSHGVNYRKEIEVLEEEIDREMTVNEAVIFDVEAGDFGDDVKDGIGGAFLCTQEPKRSY